MDYMRKNRNAGIIRNHNKMLFNDAQLLELYCNSEFNYKKKKSMPERYEFSGSRAKQRPKKSNIFSNGMQYKNMVSYSQGSSMNNNEAAIVHYQRPSINYYSSHGLTPMIDINGNPMP